MQRIVGRLKLVMRQVLMVGQQIAVSIVEFAEFGLIDRPECRGAVVADDIEYGFDAFLAHRGGELREVEIRARQMFIETPEIHAPVAVIARLATVGQDAAPLDLVATCKGGIGIVDDGRDPDTGKAHVANVVGMVQHAFEVTAQITDVVRAAVRAFERNIETSIVAPLLALVVARVAIDEAIGDDEVDGFGCEGLAGSENRGIRRTVAGSVSGCFGGIARRR